MPRLLLLSLAAVASAALAGCDGTTDDDFTAQIVVSATLGAGEVLPAVTLTTTSPFLDRYDPETLGVEGAQVTVTLLAPDGSDEATYLYTGEESGRYGPLVPIPAVLPGRTYRLDVEADGRRLTATTTVPPLMEQVGESAPRVVYGEGQGPEVRVTRSSTDGRQAAFVGSTRALDAATFEEVTVEGETRYRSVPGSGFLPTPVYRRFLDCTDEPDGALVCEEDPRQTGVVTGTSPVINEASYIDLGDGTILVQVPFLAFGYYGPYRLSLVSLDAALQAFVQTQTVQLGGSTLSPGEIPNVTTNVEGGLGVFGSFARVVVETEIVEP